MMLQQKSRKYIKIIIFIDYDLNYSVSTKCTANELIIFGNGIVPPTNEMLEQANIKINLRPNVKGEEK